MSYMMEKALRGTSAEYDAQFNMVQNQRKLGHATQVDIVDRFGHAIDKDELVKNDASQFDVKWWAEIDRRAIATRENDRGRELLTDLMGLATPVDIGNTVKTYGMQGGIDDEVKVSMDGQTPTVFDHTDTTQAGDPIPIFNTGFGINWRKWLGQRNHNLNTVAESQALKMKDILEAMCNYMLDGHKDVKAAGFPGQGIRNHRNTRKIDLTVAGIDLPSGSTTNDDILDFWNQTFAIHLDANYVVGPIDVVWVSPEIDRRMRVAYSNSQGFKGGTLMKFILEFGRVKEFRVTYKLKGNEFIAYNRDRDAITPLVSQALATVPVERRGPRDNFNFEIWGAAGLQIKADINGRGSVFYAAKLT